MFFGRKNGRQIELQVDLGDLQNEKEQLTSFLQSHLQVSVTPYGNKLKVNSEKLSAQELKRIMTKFVYHRNLNNTHWVSIEGTTIKINRFKRTTKKNRKTQEKRATPNRNTKLGNMTHTLHFMSARAFGLIGLNFNYFLPKE